MIDAFLQPLQFPFMQNAYLAGIMIALPAALLSCFLVLKGWALMGDAVSHAVLPGIVIAYAASLPLAAGAVAAGLVCVMAIGWIKDNSRVKQDTVMGVIFSGLFGFGLVLYAKVPSSLHLDHILFGNILGISKGDLVAILLISLVVSVPILLRVADLTLHAFDPLQARAMGLPVRVYHYGLLVLLCLTVVAMLQAVGLVLSIGMLIAPGAIGFMVSRRIRTMLTVAVAASLFAVLAGIHASFFIDSAPAPTIMLVFALLFLATLLLDVVRRNGRYTASGNSDPDTGSTARAPKADPTPINRG